MCMTTPFATVCRSDSKPSPRPGMNESYLGTSKYASDKLPGDSVKPGKTLENSEDMTDDVMNGERKPTRVLRRCVTNMKMKHSPSRYIDMSS